eukprot:CAMPEP_0180645726 /NCGR_PEP_ID=MMETSP1037_2-20121125/49161_1 /TAXON_ID=632150 /ORGANISM="Azadinium spinosum, Strain 3D9" /LENGTH=60 /DNA_ID=CAMNT_0022669639 /DNA_START=79 /DNA_END=257 /DNA_ORIENTATION=+
MAACHNSKLLHSGTLTWMTLCLPEADRHVSSNSRESPPCGCRALRRLWSANARFGNLPSR